MTGLPRSMSIKPSNMVIVEVIGEDNKHRMYRGFIVPVNTKGDFTCLDEVLNWIDNWVKKYPKHTCRLFFDQEILAKRYREMRKNENQTN